MPNPDSIQTGQGDELDLITDADGVVYLKAAGRAMDVDGAANDMAPHLVEDATLWSGHGSQVVAAGPVRTKLRASSTPCKRITVKAHVTNSNTLYVGLSTVTADANNSTGGFQLSPGEAFTFGADDVTDIYIHGTAAEGASFAYEL